MVPWWWSVLLTSVGIVGLFLAGSKYKLGWLLGLGAQVLWIAYAVSTVQWGFLASAGVYGFVYARNWLKWRREEQQTRVDRLWAEYEAAIIDARRSSVPVPPPVPPRTQMVTVAVVDGEKIRVERPTVILPTGNTSPGGTPQPRRR